MSETSLASAGATRRGLIDGMLGGAVGLVAITVAHAALPDPTPAPPSAKPHGRIAAAAAAAAARPPAPAPVLIAFRPPLPDGAVGSPFGLRRLPWEAKARLHAGVDLEAPKPEPVLAAADGVVARVGEDPGYGRFVELTHADGLTTLYGHMQRFASGIRQGADVKGGSPVGMIGSTGSSTGVHLHFEIHDPEGQPLNPELLVGKAVAHFADLPLSQARNIPRFVHVAFVSHIPRSKQAEMDERAEQRAGGPQQVIRTASGRVRTVTLPHPAAKAWPPLPPDVMPPPPAPPPISVAYAY